MWSSYVTFKFSRFRLTYWRFMWPICKRGVLDWTNQYRTMELLTLSLAWDPKDAYQSFNVDDVYSLVEKYYQKDYWKQCGATLTPLCDHFYFSWLGLLKCYSHCRNRYRTKKPYLQKQKSFSNCSCLKKKKNFSNYSCLTDMSMYIALFYFVLFCFVFF